LVETSFAGATMETRVVVMADVADGDNSKCEELRSGNLQNLTSLITYGQGTWTGRHPWPSPTLKQTENIHDLAPIVHVF
jgi:hypothetical protein